MSDSPPSRRYDDPSPPADATEAVEPDQSGDIAGDVGEPRARTGAWLRVSLLILGLLALALTIVFLTSEPEERRPLPATPPADLEEQ